MVSEKSAGLSSPTSLQKQLMSRFVNHAIFVLIFAGFVISKFAIILPFAEIVKGN